MEIDLSDITFAKGFGILSYDELTKAQSVFIDDIIQDIMDNGLEACKVQIIDMDLVKTLEDIINNNETIILFTTTDYAVIYVKSVHISLSDPAVYNVEFKTFNENDFLLNDN